MVGRGSALQTDQCDEEQALEEAQRKIEAEDEHREIIEKNERGMDRTGGREKV